jgi:hypothetical protein
VTLTPLAALLVSLGAVLCGGIASPLAQGVGIVTLVRAILPAPWTRALPISIVCALMFPSTLGIASMFVPQVRTQMHSPAVLTFLQTSMFLMLSAVIAAAGSHMQWAARREVDEARRLGAYRSPVRSGAVFMTPAT